MEFFIFYFGLNFLLNWVLDFCLNFSVEILIGFLLYSGSIICGRMVVKSGCECVLVLGFWGSVKAAEIAATIHTGTPKQETESHCL